LIDSPVNQVFALPESSFSAFTSRFTALDLVSDLFELFAVMAPVGIREQIVDTDIYGQNLVISFYFSVRDLNPQDKAVLAQSAPLNELGGRLIKPLIENSSALRWNSQPLALLENGQFDDRITVRKSVWNRRRHAGDSNFNIGRSIDSPDRNLEAGALYFCLRDLSAIPLKNQQSPRKLLPITAVYKRYR